MTCFEKGDAIAFISYFVQKLKLLHKNKCARSANAIERVILAIQCVRDLFFIYF